MTIVHKSIQLNYSVEQMYALVADIQSYPEFLPWCERVNVRDDKENHTVLAEMHMNVMGLRQTFTTRNVNIPPSSIHMRLEKGPFRQLDGKWTFTAIDPTHCAVALAMNYTFSNFLLEKMVGPFFNAMTADLVHAFQQRARKIYG